MLVTSALISGLALGSMYGLLALGFYVTYAVSSTVNFAQGSSMMLGAVFAYTFAVTLGWPFVPAALLALLLCALYGVLVEALAVRPFVRRGSSAWLMATVALGIVADNAVLAAGFHLFTRRTLLGRAMLAVVQNPDAARLMGINVPLAIALAYAASTLFAGAAGIMIAPLFNVHSDMGTLFGLKAFAVAILGGITSAWGVMLAGLIFGVTEALITALLGSAYTQILSFALVIVVLALMPNGLFGRAEVKKV
jgi:branched-chain amino acid transport system permease protein